MAFLLENAGSPPSANGSCRLTLLLQIKKKRTVAKEWDLIHIVIVNYYF